jgi:hypothetical protein
MEGSIGGRGFILEVLLVALEGYVSQGGLKVIR